MQICMQWQSLFSGKKKINIINLNLPSLETTHRVYKVKCNEFSSDAFQLDWNIGRLQSAQYWNKFGDIFFCTEEIVVPNLPFLSNRQA